MNKKTVCLYCGVIPILKSCLCPMSNEKKVRGLWSVIIFISETVGGCSTFVSAIRDSSLFSGDGNEHQALIICWGWHLWKKRLKINVTFHCPHMTKRREKIQQSWCRELSGESALWKCCLLEKYRNARRKDRLKEGEAVTGVRMNLMIHISSIPAPHRKLEVLFISIHTYSQIHSYNH